VKFSEEKNIDVVCIGNALMDVLVEVDDSFLAVHQLRKGTMALVDKESAERQVEEIAKKDVRTLPGGSAANTARGVSALGGTSAFFGSVGVDMYGQMYNDSMHEAGVKSYLHDGSELTGFAVAYITPDQERTFAVHLGAASDVPLSIVDMEVLRAAKVLHLEAYQLEGATKPTLETVIKETGNYDTKVSLDLNDAGLIERNLELFREIVTSHVDILFLNETEAAAFTGKTEPNEVIAALRGQAELVIYKCGGDGAHIIAKDGVTTIAAHSVEVVDTTGAGDLFAAGFLRGITSGQSLAEAGVLGAKAASVIITEIGVDVERVRGL
jgi:sugar/nucleoside kinase (ribokinase family)